MIRYSLSDDDWLVTQQPELDNSWITELNNTELDN